ncbi:3-keto-5-aminohexanoate cleavage protein [Agromyces lapidis]|uniref:3-keto-5-aminohexanoate cleavage protein n=1 Tax=Agromyces lapidis TaxID=279574 RepID=A0ABV5SKI1_9MICO|nr:3-keto-5-aminohexanoate cleavage protein [Agromyces lapidis]
MLLKAAINGGRPLSEHPAVPRTTEQIVEASRAAIAAGADVVHAHVLTAEGAQTIHPDAVGAWVSAMRAADASIVIGTTTGLWTVESHAQRMAHVAAWPADALPDFASVAFCEEGAAEAAELVLERGMVLESAVWSMADVPALLASPTLHRNVRILIEPETEDPVEAVAQCREISAAVRGAGVTAPILYHGYDATVWPVVEAAIADGCETRIGFEDGVLLPDGRMPVDNAELVSAVRELERARTLV